VNNNLSQLTRAQGVLLGQLAGDALGSMVEFKSVQQIRELHPSGLRQIGPSPVFGTLAGQPTDDSEMALALDRTLVQHGFDVEQIARSYATWMDSPPFDSGGTTRQALFPAVAALQEGQPVAEAARNHASRSSEANGALMRQSPLAVWGANLPSEQLAAYVAADTELTHPSPVCVDASCAYIVALAAAVREGLDAAATYERAVAWQVAHGRTATITDALAAAASQLPADYQTHMGHVPIALQNAFYQLLHAPDLEAGVVATVMAGGDTDTNAAIAAALLGGVYRLEAVPEQWCAAVLSCRPEAGSGSRYPRPAVYWPTDALELAEKLLG